MRPHRFVEALALGMLGLVMFGSTPAGGQESEGQAKPKDVAQGSPSGSEASPDFGSLDELHAFYDEQAVQTARRRIDDLTKLAAKATGDDAEAAYEEIFNLAVSRDLYPHAEKAAESYLGREDGDSHARGLAAFINAIAQAGRGEYDRSLADLESFLKAKTGAVALEPNTMFSVGEAFLQRLIRSHRYDVARQVCELFVNNATDDDVRRHFSARMERIGMLGKEAPPIVGVDVDGHPINLAEMKGKVVLVDFWATWCPPCVAEIPNLHSLTKTYGDKGFTILGINLDTAHPDVKGLEQALPLVRKFLIDFRVTWPSVVNGGDGKDFTKPYGVREIPATFLIGRDGKIIHVELSGDALERAVRQAVGEKEETAFVP